jgi:[NiFe] hydrogenase diaphorase moiety large subunit
MTGPNAQRGRVEVPYSVEAARDGHPELSPTEAAAIAHALDRWSADRLHLVQILREVQAQTAWLSPAVLQRIGEAVGQTGAEVAAVASFYRFFHLRPAGRLQILFSDNVTDQFLGSRSLVDDLCRRLGIRPGEVAADGSVRIGYTSCTGLGDQGPAALVDHHQVLTRLTPTRIAEIADRIRVGVPASEWPAEWQQVDDQVRQAGLLLGGRLPRGAALQAMLQRDAANMTDGGPPATMAELERSRLRGRGGAGFTTGHKWALTRDAPLPEATAELVRPTRVVVCNADEGEPGTFKDRVLLTRDADGVFEGMTVAARQIRAGLGFVYLRGEYRYLLPRLERVLEQRRADGLLGRSILGVEGFDFDIRIHLGAGAYVCGEESALLESLEGRRGVPRVRPPYPAQVGYRRQPTIVNNVETLLAAACIAWEGADPWLASGSGTTTGSKLHSVSGDCERPGIYEMASGVTVRELLDACGARDTLGVQIGGPSGRFIGAAEFQRRLGFEDLPTTGAFMVFDRRRDPFEIARSFAHFFAHESCGFCTPCRVGTELVARRMDKLAHGRGSVFEPDELRDLEALLHTTTHCGLGATATNPVRDTLLRWPEAYARRAARADFQPRVALDDELAASRALTGRDDEGAHLDRETTHG